MKLFSTVALVLSVVFLVLCVIIYLSGSQVVEIGEVMPYVTVYVLLNLIYAIASIGFMRKSRRWRRGTSRG
ncbi:lipopolysaccharide export LptBFGC system permease protein LptF [Lewinella aquimaris]|uniref:Lipopolysaccharide export LptBFGC system permease protein LptF n=1 Tax=Neolewinella aquimaris TaxID=1835722 RepID=A0A840EIG7_9BACT|nr:hypothetical protein [Neolewinella aquimaris]MBB4080686.1 lipopolysaccharide export LptBFGC system permease protein LptF [Neolewinella aquimaris]